MWDLKSGLGVGGYYIRIITKLLLAFETELGYSLRFIEGKQLGTYRKEIKH